VGVVYMRNANMPVGEVEIKFHLGDMAVQKQLEGFY
jgi:hypothetical protein